MPAWANPADAPSRSKPIESWFASLPKLCPPPIAVFAPACAFPELNLLRCRLSAAGHAVGEHVRKLESSGALSCSEMKPAYVENEASQVTYVDASNIVRQLSREGVKKKNKWKDETADWSHTSCWPCHDSIFITPSWFSEPPGLALPVGAGPDCWRNELLYRGGDIERHHGPKHH